MSEVPGYVSCQGDDRPRNRVGHRLDTIVRVLDRVGGPPGACSDWSAAEVFTGYLVFDAWIANTDRHAVNWAVLQDGPRRRLSPSFDHGSALGSGLLDTHLPGVSTFWERARAGRFEDGQRIALVDLARAAVASVGGRSPVWLDRIADVTDDQIEDLLAAAPPGVGGAS